MFCVGQGDANPVGGQGAFLPSVPKVSVFSTNLRCATLYLGAHSSPHGQCPPELPNREATGTSYSLPLPTRPLPPLRTMEAHPAALSCLTVRPPTKKPRPGARGQDTARVPTKLLFPLYPGSHCLCPLPDSSHLWYQEGSIQGTQKGLLIRSQPPSRAQEVSDTVTG